MPWGRQPTLAAAALAVLAASVLVADLASHRVAKEIILASAPPTTIPAASTPAAQAPETAPAVQAPAAAAAEPAVAVAASQSTAVPAQHQFANAFPQENLDWLWKQGPDEAVKSRMQVGVSTAQPPGKFITKSVPPIMRMQHLMLGDGLPRELRKISVNRQDLWTYGPKILGHNDFIADGFVPPDVPVIGTA